jgi:tetratricopeptide (TPR) repeat protein
MRSGTLDFHLFQTYHLARSEHPGRACSHALAAARLLAAVFRYGEAADYYELALRLLPRDRSSAAVRVLGALESACRKGGLHLRGKRVSLELLRRRRSLAQYAAAAHFIRLVDGPAAAVALIDAGLRADCRRSPWGLAHLHSKRAAALALGGRHVAAQGSAQRAESYLSECRNPAIAADVYLDIGSVHYLRGDLPRATEYYLAALRLTRRTRDASREAALCDNIALTLRSRLDLSGALRYARRALEIKSRRGLELDSAVTRMVLGALYDDAGDREAGRAEIGRARETFRSRGDQVRQAWASYGIASIHLAAEEYPDAMEWLDRTLEEAPKDTRHGLVLAAYAGKTQVFLATGELEKAKECLRLGAAALHSGVGFEARLAWARGRILHASAQGDLQEAGRLLREAGRELRRSEAVGYRFQFEILDLEIRLAAGTAGTAAEQAEKLVAALDATELRPLRGEALLVAAEIQIEAGNPRRAAALLGRLGPLLERQPPPSWRIRSALLRSRLAASTSERIRASTEALRTAAKHELRPLCHAAALELARSYEAREDYSSAIRYYQEAGEYAGSRSA